MEVSEIERRIAGLVGNAEIDIEGQDCNFTVSVISDDFVGLSQVKRQQLVLTGFNDVLASGELHALSVKPFTPEEWQNRFSSLVQINL